MFVVFPMTQLILHFEFNGLFELKYLIILMAVGQIYLVKLKGYLWARFTLVGGVSPHELRFWCYSLFNILHFEYWNKLSAIMRFEFWNTF